MVLAHSHSGDASGWVALALSLWPFRDADGSYASSPYGLTTNLENKAVDLMFQLRDVVKPDRRAQAVRNPLPLSLSMKNRLKHRKYDRKSGRVPGTHSWWTKPARVARQS